MSSENPSRWDPVKIIVYKIGYELTEATSQIATRERKIIAVGLVVISILGLVQALRLSTFGNVHQDTRGKEKNNQS